MGGAAGDEAEERYATGLFSYKRVKTCINSLEMILFSPIIVSLWRILNSLPPQGFDARGASSATRFLPAAPGHSEPCDQYRGAWSPSGAPGGGLDAAAVRCRAGREGRRIDRVRCRHHRGRDGRARHGRTPDREGWVLLPSPRRPSLLEAQRPFPLLQAPRCWCWRSTSSRADPPATTRRTDTASMSVRTRTSPSLPRTGIRLAVLGHAATGMALGGGAEGLPRLLLGIPRWLPVPICPYRSRACGVERPAHLHRFEHDVWIRR